MKSPTTVAVAAALSSLALTACTQTLPAPSAPSASTRTPDATQTAVDAAHASYYGARTAMAGAARTPRATLQDYPEDLGLTKFLDGAALKDVVDTSAALAKANVRIESEIGLSVPKTASVSTSKIVFAHCGADERYWIVRHGSEEREPTKPGPDEAPWPHLSTYTMSLRNGHWKLTQITTDVKKTCQPDAL